MEEKDLDLLIFIHDKIKTLNWFEGEHYFQVILETIGTQQCKLIDSAIWSYELKLLADESVGGNMIEEVESELNGWLEDNDTTWEKETSLARNKQDWGEKKLRFLIKDDINKKTSIAVRSLWAWYGRNFPKRVWPQFITVKEWSDRHKEWLLNTNIEFILDNTKFKIIGIERKLKGIKQFIEKEKDGELNGLTIDNAREKLQTIISIGLETAPKIALFYFNIPLPIFDEYLLRFCNRHRWIVPEIRKWNTFNIQRIDRLIRDWFRNDDVMVQCKKIKSIHAIIDDCGNLYCKKQNSDCENCPLSPLIPNS